MDIVWFISHVADVGSGGSTNVTLVFPKNAMSVVVGEVYVVLSIVFVFIVTVRS